jgi:hypothetical protein
MGDGPMSEQDSGSPPCSRAHLRLISGAKHNEHSAEVFIRNAKEESCTADELRAEAEALEAWHGPNAYSNYLRKHGHRPDIEQAKTIGRLLGGRVQADDGSMQPPLSKADRDVIRNIKGRRRAASRRYDHILRLRAAIAALSENEDDPAEVIGCGSFFLDEPATSTQLHRALTWLNRFAEEWHGRQKEARAPSLQPVGSDQGQSGTQGCYIGGNRCGPPQRSS